MRRFTLKEIDKIYKSPHLCSGQILMPREFAFHLLKTNKQIFGFPRFLDSVTPMHDCGAGHLVGTWGDLLVKVSPPLSVPQETQSALENLGQLWHSWGNNSPVVITQSLRVPWIWVPQITSFCFFWGVLVKGGMGNFSFLHSTLEYSGESKMDFLFFAIFLLHI